MSSTVASGARSQVVELLACPIAVVNFLNIVADLDGQVETVSKWLRRFPRARDWAAINHFDGHWRQTLG
jgi:hypothetical protein